MKSFSLALILLLLSACKTGEILLTSAIGGYSGSQIVRGEIYQTYYLGIIDPIEQLPPTFYRITVRGQASIFSDMKFASGWIPAEAVDTLTTNVGIDLKTGEVKAGSSEKTGINPRRRFVLIGPEGVREGPDSHRLAIVMGASPHNFFRAMDEALGSISTEVSKVNDKQLATHLLAELYKIEQLEKQFNNLKLDEGNKKEGQ